jgi:hypothetical protein
LGLLDIVVLVGVFIVVVFGDIVVVVVIVVGETAGAVFVELRELVDAFLLEPGEVVAFLEEGRRAIGVGWGRGIADNVVEFRRKEFFDCWVGKGKRCLSALVFSCRRDIGIIDNHGFLSSRFSHPCP